MFNRFLLLVFLIDIIDCELNNTDQCPNVKTHLGSIRKRRHLTFPDGSDVVLTISVVKAFMTHAPSGWNLALEIDVLYPLPDANFTNAHSRRKLHHRQKREFWERVRSALEFHNLNGRACLLRSICEAKTYLAEPGRSLVHDILKAIFTIMDLKEAMELYQDRAKLKDVISAFPSGLWAAPLHEPEFVEEVGGTYNELLDPHFCETDYDCPFSLLHFVLALNKQKY